MPDPIRLEYSTAPRTPIGRLRARYPGLVRVAEFIATPATVYFVFSCIAFVAMVLFRIPYYALIIAAVIVFTALRMITGARQRADQRLLHHVEAATRLSVPLASYLAIAADSEPRRVARRLRNVAQTLSAGESLAVAIAAEAPELDHRALRLIRLGEATHRLPEMLTRLQRNRSEARQSPSTSAFLAWYLPIAVVTLTVVISMILIFVIPKFETIMRDYKVPLPPSTRCLLQFSRWVSQDFGWIALLPVLFVAMLWSNWNILRILRPRSPGFHPRYRDTLLDYLPLIGKARYDRAMADLCWGLAGACRDELPLSAAVHELMGLPMHTRHFARLAAWHTALGQGLAPADAATTAGLPPLLASVFRTAGPNLADSLDVLGDFYDTRSHRLLVLLQSAAIPFFTLLLAGCVFFIMIALLSPLQLMIDHAMAPIGRVQ